MNQTGYKVGNRYIGCKPYNNFERQVPDMALKNKYQHKNDDGYHDVWK